jgi:hypothetical protein
MITTRREFLSGLIPVALAPLGISLGASGCSSGGVSDSLRDGGPTSCSMITPRIGLNHGHRLVVPLADVEAGNSKTYQITSNGQHPHTVHVTAAQFAELASGTTVTAESSNDAGHTHSVVFTCVALS